MIQELVFCIMIVNLDVVYNGLKAVSANDLKTRRELNKTTVLIVALNGNPKFFHSRHG